MSWNVGDAIDKIRAMTLPVFVVAVNADLRNAEPTASEQIMSKEWREAANGDELLLVDGVETRENSTWTEPVSLGVRIARRIETAV